MKYRLVENHRCADDFVRCCVNRHQRHAGVDPFLPKYLKEDVDSLFADLQLGNDRLGLVEDLCEQVKSLFRMLSMVQDLVLDPVFFGYYHIVYRLYLRIHII